MELGLYNHLAVQRPFIAEPNNILAIGKTKTGKSFLLEHIAIQEIKNGKSIIFFGNGENILERVPRNFQSKVLYINPSVQPFAFNFIHSVPLTLQPLLASTVTEAIISLSGFSIEPVRLKKYFSFGIQTLLNAKSEYTFLDMKRLLTDEDFRTKVVGEVSDPVLKDFWNDFNDLNARDRNQYIESTLTRLYAVLLEPQIRNCLGQRTNRLVLKDKIVIVSLSEAHMGKDNANLMGALILAMVNMEGLQGLQTTLIVDDAFRYGSAVLTSILNGCPSINTLYSLQSLDQMKNPVADRILAFRTTPKDAELLASEIQLNPGQTDINHLGDFEAYTQVGSRAERLTIPYYEHKRTEQEDKIIRRCRIQCSAPKEVIERKLGRMFSVDNTH